MSLSGVSFAGLSSGIDTDSIIAKLVSLEKQPITRFQSQQKSLNNKIKAYKSISAQLYGFQSAASNLTYATTYRAVTSSSSAADNITVSSSSGAQTGTYNVTVNNLATAQQISSSSQPNTTDPLGYEGQILINGKAIQVKATDTLSTLATNINAANAGVSAGIITPSTGQNYLTLSSNTTGVKGAIQIADTAGGTFLSTRLGITDGASTAIANPVGAAGAGSSVFKNSGTSLGTLLGLTSPAAGTIKIAGQSISVDFSTDTLSSLSNKITAANIPGVSATVVTTTDARTGDSGQQLQISGTTSFTDDKNLLTDLGVLKNNLQTGRELSGAKDASFTVNGLTATRSSNTVSDVITGVTLNLLQGGGKSSTIAVNRDTDGIKSKIQSFVAAYNNTLDSIDVQSSFDPETNASGVLLGDAVAQGIADNLIQAVSSKIPGVGGGSVSLLADIGLTLNNNGRLQIDDTKLSSAVSTGNLNDISRLFKADGVASSPLLEFVSSTNDTQPSGDGQYRVRISKAAAQAVVTAGSAQVGTLTQDETLTFGGSLFGTTLPASPTDALTGKTISLKAGSSLNDIVSTINSNDLTKDLVTASVVDGKLTFTSKLYGAGPEFAVSSGVANDPSGHSTGIGSTYRSAKGVDVAGEIGVLISGRAGTADTDYRWEAATGSGQQLTGSKTAFGLEPNGKTLGLKIRVTAKQSDFVKPDSLTVGSVKFTRGVGDVVNGYLNVQNDTYKGSIGGATTDLQSQIDAFDGDIKDLNARVKDYETNLRLKYSTMETNVSRIKSAQASLAKLGG